MLEWLWTPFFPSTPVQNHNLTLYGQLTAYFHSVMKYILNSLKELSQWKYSLTEVELNQKLILIKQETKTNTKR